MTATTSLPSIETPTFFQLDAEEQVAAEPLDRQRAVQVLVRFAHDVAAQPVLEPRRLRHDDAAAVAPTTSVSTMTSA